MNKFCVCVCLMGVAFVSGCGDGSSSGEVDRAELNEACDYLLATVLNRDDLLACEVAFEPCEDWELENLVKQFECDVGERSEGCPEGGQPEVEAGCMEQLAMIKPAENDIWQSLSGTNWCGPGGSCENNYCSVSRADGSCRRHDSGYGYDSSSHGSCGVDSDLYDANSFWGPWPETVIVGVFNPFNSAWFCYNYDSVCTSRDWWGSCSSYNTQKTKRYWNKYGGSVWHAGYRSSCAGCEPGDLFCNSCN